jgi:hypothetical protein
LVVVIWAKWLYIASPSVKAFINNLATLYMPFLPMAGKAFMISR